MYQSSTRAPTLHQWDIADASSLPLSQEKRKRTDVCCLIVGLLLGLGLLIAAIVVHNSGNLNRSQFPTDSKGTICQLDARNSSGSYPFLYFNDLRDPFSRRYCVEECPQQGVPTNCFGKSCDISFYPNYPSSSGLGALCLPQDPNLKAQLLEKSGMARRFNAQKAVDMLLIGVGVTFGLALLWMLLVQFLPRAAVWIALGVSAALLLLAAVYCFLGAHSHFSEDSGLAIVVGIVFILFFLLIILYVCFHKRQVELCGCFLEVATDCLRDNLRSLLYLLLFISLTILFIVLLVFQYLSFASANTTLNGIYYQNECNGWVAALLVLQAVWGFSFFRDAFNYVMSGIADEWYFHKIDTLCYPLRRFFLKNIGSVVGGSLLTGFFYLPALIFSFLAPNVDCTLCNLFDLARSDVYSYIYLTGNSYCPSSRQVQYLCRRSRICRENENATAIYAFAARLTTALLAVLIVYWISKANLVYQEVPFTVLLGVFFACMYLGCYFSDIHAIIAEALVVCFLTEYDMEEGWSYKEMRACPTKLTQLVSDIQNNGERVLPWQ